MKKWNHYKCQRCGKITVARHDNEGVTPFILGCYDSTCPGDAQSSFFDNNQADDQRAHVIFWRPATLIEAIEVINKEPVEHREWYLNHYKQGGSLMRKTELCHTN